MKYMVVAIIFSLSSLCQAQEVSEGNKAEIEHLFKYLEGSGCEFNRNGTWYNAADASAHIKKKYDYLLGKHLLSSSESFIEKAASESSVSGKLYQVKCGTASPVQSSIWFNLELKKYRAEKSH